MENKEIDMETYFNNQKFKDYIDGLIKLGKEEGLKVGDGVIMTDLCLNTIKHSFESEGIDLTTINFPFIGKLLISKIIEPTTEDPVGHIEVRCEDINSAFTFRKDDAQERYLELIYREGIPLPENIELNIV